MSSVIVIVGGLIVIRWQLQLSAQPEKQGSQQKMLHVYNYGSYIDPDLLTKFTKQTGYQVSYATYDSNESMMVKLKQGGSNYDLVFPSEPYVAKLAQENLLAPLDHQKIRGLENLDPMLLNHAFDPNNRYSLPYFWGTTGIMYNAKVFSKDEVDTWAKLWAPKMKDQVMLIDAPRESIGMGLQALGYSENDHDSAHIQAARQKLAALAPNVKAVLNDEIRAYVTSGEANVAVAYSGVADYAHALNPDIDYVIPKDGGSVWTDNISIPKNAQNKAGAYAFINFLLDPKNAAQNAEFVAYSSPNLAAKKYLSKEITSDKILYPQRSELAKVEHYENLTDKTVRDYSNNWLEAKMAMANGGK
ncbi:spermidine/putrescine ABC transporter substrate-binding protein [Leuconostoc lactis]|uniref:ABC transporter substrate-binding protein n=1 Tax=Leuconostoc lactis TaxID=1246 RepID=UPI001D10F29D|nr:spermidine/putrescine ABC transporter substrate-binding protein [Leuconostoc lactis]MCC2744254.1 spermidine/putrescine ABC transporter substrate-binding protein [Leuconostoc lactis]MCC2754419.1 spermidine/putrescine ABC transporter substrate-binding protein [Leuconostoc lactis]